jgi:hypothetical protein
VIRFAFRALVHDVSGRTVLVQPDTQIIRSMVSWATSGLVAPGVQDESGSGRYDVEQDVGATCTNAGDAPAGDGCEQDRRIHTGKGDERESAIQAEAGHSRTPRGDDVASAGANHTGRK